MKTVMKNTLTILLLSCIQLYAQLPNVKNGRIIRITDFKSHYVDTRNIDIWLPDNYSKDQLYDVLYLHDGQMLFDATNTWNKQEWRIDETMQTLINESKINATIVVGIWNNGKYRHSEYFPEAFLSDLRLDFKEDFLDTWLQNKPQSDNYLKFITEEVMPYIETNFSVNTGKKHTFIGGSSMGGLISMYAVSKYPQKFGGVMGLSTAWIGQRQPNTDIPIAAFNYFQKNMPSPLDLRVYQDHGTIETDQNYNNYQSIIDELFRDFGFKDFNYKSLVFEHTGHNETDWAKRLAIPLEYLLKKRRLQETHTGKIIHIENFKSKFIPNRNVDIWLPPDYNPQKKYPVIYAQDGQMLFDPTTTWNNQSWDVDDVISNLSANDSIPEIIVIGIFNGDSKRLEEYLPEKVINRLSKEEKAFVYAKLREKCRTDNDFVPYSDNYLKFVVEELKPYIDANYATQKEKDSTVIMGSSAGGILAAYALLEYPQIFGSAICLSSHWIGIFQTENNPFPDQLIKYFDEKLPLISNNKLFMDVADTGLDILYQPTQKRIDQLVMKYNIPKENWKTVYQKNAEHSELSWNKRLPEALKFIFNK
jgi:enterochelin esterase-like enzyme